MNKKYFLFLATLISSACLFADEDGREPKPIQQDTTADITEVVVPPDAQPEPTPPSEPTETK